MSRLVQMRPSLAGQDALDLLLAHAKPSGNLALGERAAKAADFSYLRFSQFGLPVLRAFARRFKAGAVGVHSVLAGRAPFKVVGAVVLLVSVLVVDLVAFRRGWPKEGRGHKPVNHLRMVFSAFEKGGFNVAGTIISRSKNYRAALNRPNISGIGYFVGTFVPKNRMPQTHRASLSILDTLSCNIGDVSLQQANQGDLH